MTLFPRRAPTGIWWRDHSLSIVLVVLTALQVGLSLYFGRREWEAGKDSHAPFWEWWTYEFSTSIVADSYGVLIVVLLTKWFIERGSAESN